ncbi:LysR family transcriptional regulator [uncultured Hymenobacter sp.]|uniref:LysR family transcriptional regulator n=1 Tax=uncultured Hymenobacter sp. TaxID=170016 RepID=UPI0035C96B9A
MIDTRHLQLVVAVVEAGSLTRAADMLYLSQPALSHQLKRLERQIGVQLFERRNRMLVPTPAGQQFLERARPILLELHHLQAAMDSLRQGERRLVRLSTECYTCYHWLPAVISQFEREAGNVQVQIVANATQNPLAALVNQELDLAIVSTKPEQPNLPLFEDEMVALVSARHPYATTKRELTPLDFATETFIYYDIPDQRSWVLSQFLGQYQVQPQTKVKVQLTEAIIEMVKANMGVAVLAKWAVQPHLHLNQLVTLPLVSETKTRTWYAALSGPPDPTLATFIRCIQQRFNTKLASPKGS